MICFQIKLKSHNQVIFDGLGNNVVDTTEPRLDTVKRSEKRQANLDV